MISDPKAPGVPANQWEPTKRAQKVSFLFRVRWPSHPPFFRVVGEPLVSAGAATKGCRSSRHSRQKGLARGSGDPAQVHITSEGLSSEVEVVECSTISCNLAVSYFSEPHNVGCSTNITNHDAMVKGPTVREDQGLCRNSSRGSSSGRL